MLLLIEGPAGAGKTVLAREARAAAERARIMPLEARGSELEQPFAFGVVRQLLEPVIRKEPGHADLFAGAAGPAARLFAPGERPSLDAGAGFEALHSLYWLVVNIADQAPVLVLVDDCQWADRDSLRFLAYLAQRIEGLPVTMLLAGRPPEAGGDDAGALWAQLASRPDAAPLYPRPLSQSAAVTLARERLGAAAAEEFCRACHAATGGNPLFLRELLGALAAAGVEPSAAAASTVQDVGPAVVSRFVLHRLAALGPAATELARAVAVLGDDSEPLLAGRMSGLSQDDAREAADDLVRADIFIPAERLGFVHPILRPASARPGTRRPPRPWLARVPQPSGSPRTCCWPRRPGICTGSAHSGWRRTPRRTVALRGRPPRTCGERWPSPRPSRIGGRSWLISAGTKWPRCSSRRPRNTCARCWLRAPRWLPGPTRRPGWGGARSCPAAARHGPRPTRCRRWPVSCGRPIPSDPSSWALSC